MLTITGPMRSGTSIVARIAHQLGVSMGTHMRMPPPGSGLDPEYEDVWLADAISRDALELQPAVHRSAGFQWYIQSRQEKAGDQPWGFKSPLLALYWSEWLEAAEACGEPVVTVLCWRAPSVSFDSCVMASSDPEHTAVLMRLHRRVLAAMRGLSKPDLIVQFGTPPQQIAERLASLMGIEHYDPEMAVKGIRT